MTQRISRESSSWSPRSALRSSTLGRCGMPVFSKRMPCCGSSWRSSVVSAETGPLRLLGEEVCRTYEFTSFHRGHPFRLRHEPIAARRLVPWARPSWRCILQWLIPEKTPCRGAFARHSERAAAEREGLRLRSAVTSRLRVRGKGGTGEGMEPCILFYPRFGSRS
jgi:hypothetical protein